jgi:hypothetical protein
MGNEFITDMDIVIEKIIPQLNNKEIQMLYKLRKELIEMYNRNIVKINHTVIELIIASYLIKNGYNVNIEYDLNGISCDIYAKKGLGNLLVEVETGFVPPDHALDPITYLKARITSKIIRYSAFANKFALASTPYYIMQIPSALTKPPRFRSDEEIAYMKSLCDLYYTNPPVSLEEIRNSRLHSIFIVDVDKVEVKELEVNEYMGKKALWKV